MQIAFDTGDITDPLISEDPKQINEGWRRYHYDSIREGFVSNIHRNLTDCPFNMQGFIMQLYTVYLVNKTVYYGGNRRCCSTMIFKAEHKPVEIRDSQAKLILC